MEGVPFCHNVAMAAEAMVGSRYSLLLAAGIHHCAGENCKMKSGKKVRIFDSENIENK